MQRLERDHGSEPVCLVPAAGGAASVFTESQNHRITESQNHRIVGVGRDLCGSSSPPPLPKQGHLQ